MTITNQYGRLPLEMIRYDRSSRQRQPGDAAETIDVSDLLPSIEKRGVILPIIVEQSGEGYHLLMGERRYLASKQLGIPDIPYRLVEDLTNVERQILELEENVKRRDLPWKDFVRSVEKIHKLLKQADPTWTEVKTGLEVGISQGTVSIILRVGEELAIGNKLVEESNGFRAAYNTIVRKDDRLIDDAMNDLLSNQITPPIAAPLIPQTIHAEAKPQSVALTTPPQPISVLNSDFFKWAPIYGGVPFSLIHCDFPYGIQMDESEQGNTKSYGGYADDDQLYWSLIDCLCINLDRIMTQSGHLFFWTKFDMERVHQTLTYFTAHKPELVFSPLPLIWHKTDNRGIVADARRRPRNVCEIALIASRNDRFIIKPVSNAYGAPSTKEIHQSEKPEPMLRHFFQMFVDSNTRLLDPTCGSGTSLRAAESLGAVEVLGLELNPEFADAAKSKLRHFRNLRSLEKKL